MPGMASEMWQRIRAARREARLTQQQLADKVGVSKAAVAQWEAKSRAQRTTPTTQNLLAISRETGAPVKWLTDNTQSAESSWTWAPHESPPPLNIAETRPRGGRISNVAPGPPVRSMVPMISSVQAGTWSEARAVAYLGDAEDWIPCPVKSCSAQTYALRVTGNSMTSPYGKSYPDGCIIFVDPEQNGCAPGDRVIAKLPDRNEVTFKQLASDGVRQFLKPLNPQDEPIYGDFKIIGRVIGKYEPE